MSDWVDYWEISLRNIFCPYKVLDEVRHYTEDTKYYICSLFYGSQQPQCNIINCPIKVFKEVK